MTKFWKPILAVLLVCALALSGGAMLAKPAASAASETPASTAAPQAAPVSADEEFRAVWVATVYRLDYPVSNKERRYSYEETYKLSENGTVLKQSIQTYQ